MKLNEILQYLTGDRLREYVRLVAPREKVPNRKADMAKVFQLRFLERIEEFWHKLSEIEQQSIAESIYWGGEQLDKMFLVSRVGSVPSNMDWDPLSQSQTPPIFRLFVYDIRWHKVYVVPSEVSMALKSFVQEPPEWQLQSIDELPRTREGNGGTKRITARETEITSKSDLQAVMGLVAQGRISVSERKSVATAQAIREIAEVLHLRDDDDKQLDKEGAVEIGTMRAFAWTRILQAGKFVDSFAKRMTVSQFGERTLQKPLQEVFSHLFRYWITSDFDEFQRIEMIKIKPPSEFSHEYHPMSRRLKILRALAKCPAGRWVKLSDFTQFMCSIRPLFYLTHGDEPVYINNERLWLDTRNPQNWDIIEGRYVRCFLFEYAATLGLVDVAYVRPEVAAEDLNKYPRTSALKFVSRYDGLVYFRITASGQRLLKTGEPAANSLDDASAQDQLKLSISSNLKIQIVDGDLTVGAELVLDKFAERLEPNSWRLDRSRAVASIEAGNDISELEHLLRASDDQPLPETVEGFIITAGKQARALKRNGTAIILECADEKIAEVIATHKCTAEFCHKYGDKNLVVPVGLEGHFRKGLHILGFGIAADAD